MPPSPAALFATAEGKRLVATRTSKSWRAWGPYLSERQWGTVREDYSPNGDSWSYFTHDQARSRAYRWGEDGIAGFGDQNLHWCLGLALWNGQDAILKERLFGLANQEGNHGEDVKELYYYIDALPTHSYMRMLYKYPQAAYPYERLLSENRKRGYDDREFELTDTGIFAENRYFDVFVEYAKAAPDDILMRVTIANRGPDAAPLHVLPQLWARNIWDWTARPDLPEIRRLADDAVSATHPDMPKDMRLDIGQPAQLLFCDNETNRVRIYNEPAAPGPFKDGFHDYVIGGLTDSVRAEGWGTKCAAHHEMTVPAGEERVLRLRFRPADNAAASAFVDFDAIFAARRAEADEFYNAVHGKVTDPELRRVQRQAFAGMLWSKQFYHYDVRAWLMGDPAEPKPPQSRWQGRNADWVHMYNADIVSMPDKWEYPWYASWDLAFHSLPLAKIDPEFAKEQLLLLVGDNYMHPNGQLPAYEYAFGDANPPIHAWATWRVFSIDREMTGIADYTFLKRMLNKLMLNFTWWVNRRDAGGRNIFQGGFLGLDNIGIFDRSSPVPMGGTLSQSDATAWMAMSALNLMRISIEVALVDSSYQDMAIKYFEHFLYIVEAAAKHGGLWDEQDEFFYDRLELGDGQEIPIRARTIVGLIPLFAVEVVRHSDQPRLPEMVARMKWFLEHRPDLAALVSNWETPGYQSVSLLSMLRGHRMKCLLRRMLAEDEFLSPYGVRSVSRAHEKKPYVFAWGGQEFSLPYWPAESHSGLFGGNSNWRGPIWTQMNYLIIDSLRLFHAYYGDEFKVECPVGSGIQLTLADIADELARRVAGLFLADKTGRRAAVGESEQEQTDPHFRDLSLFYEYFDGDTGRGLGASHQTGWTGLVALLIGDIA
ncbi:MGH1-like glycoside hydrolase domain-containing protein [Acidisoma silvae]|uniref:Glucosidase n=1 Tax=Acidisoma silvae TaxID=2802396 RepID=A0A964DWZ8_9PROT|nr:glucosidase [Acidisoma silvae]MCB8873735.1 glucosidase [Acidisoma silvae]